MYYSVTPFLVCATVTTMAAKTATLAIRLPDEVVRILDQLVDQHLFSSRSEAIREFCRDWLTEAR